MPLRFIYDEKTQMFYQERPSLFSKNKSNRIDLNKEYNIEDTGIFNKLVNIVIGCK